MSVLGIVGGGGVNWSISNKCEPDHHVFEAPGHIGNEVALTLDHISTQSGGENQVHICQIGRSHYSFPIMFTVGALDLKRFQPRAEKTGLGHDVQSYQ